MNDTNLQDRIDAYLLGRMTSQEKADFEKEISGDADKREQLEFTATVRKALSDRQRRLDMFRRLNSHYEATHSEQHERRVAAASIQYAGCAAEAACAVPAASTEDAGRGRRPSGMRWLKWSAAAAAVLVAGLIVYNPFNMKHEIDTHTSNPNSLPGSENIPKAMSAPEASSETGMPAIADSVAADTTGAKPAPEEAR